MEFATGAMGTLIPKLGELLLDEYNLKDTVKKGIVDLKAELESMQVVLVKVSSVPMDQLDPQVKNWANEVRELSYAIEDNLDSFVTRVEGVEPTKPKFKHLLKMARNKFTKFKARHEIANDIEDIESQVRKIKERYDRYKIDDVVANLATTIVDPRLSALYKKVSDLVGTEEPIDELMKILSEDAETSQKDMKVVSIVGFGGLGKTTLAKALYDKVSKTYDYRGFVPVGQNQCTKKVLGDILFELDKELHKAAERLDERQLINQLQEVLARKRCEEQEKSSKAGGRDRGKKRLESTMEFATGAMGTLIPKLGKLLVDEYNLKDTVKKGIGDLKAELESMQGFLVKVSSVPVDQLDLQVKIWANEVRELSYAIEDRLDSFVTRVTKPKFKNLLKIVRNKITKLKARHEIANDMEEFESQVRKIKERYDRYKIHDVVANLATTTVDPRLSALYNKVFDLVGTEEPIDELIKILSEGAETPQKNPKIVSVVGFGGLGKTTLAKALYDKVSKTYECQGFVPVGQNQSVKKVLSDILFELDKELYKATERLDERKLINQLQEVLAGKRYFIVIDDLWDIQTWELIKCAFVDSHPESKIIITTRDRDVATNAGGIYHMKPLSYDNSKMLFHTRTCGVEGVSQDNQPDEVTNKILKKCGGVPLAIISIASLLVSKVSADWSKVYDAIGFGDEDSQVIQNTRKILSFSYYDLRPYLKTCLLYLGMYPEDKFIDKKLLIWRWVSEGFVSGKQGIGSYELAENYYNDLVNKSLIREVFFNGQEGCRVHDMVLDMIRTMSMEVNFVTVQDTEENQMSSSPSGQGNRVHRLAFHGAKVKHDASIKMGHVRSFSAITCSNSGIPPLSIFNVLRVLVIEDCVLSEDLSMKNLGKLVQLRYLGLVNTSVQLPDDIGLVLKLLDVRGGSISELPASVGELQNLRCLWADGGTRMKGEIGKLTCLEELQLDQADKVPNFFRDVGKLTKLRLLRIWLDRLEETAAKVLAVSLLNLHKIQVLIINRNEVESFSDLFNIELLVCAGSLEELTPSSRLRSFYMESILITKMPSWINALSVPLLSQLELHVEVVEAQDLQILGRLPSLIRLYFFGAEKKCVSYTFGSDEFQKLKLLMTNVEITLGEGGLPMLETLIYSASARRKDSLVPWNNSCPSLDSVICQLDCANSGRKEVKAAKAIPRKAERTHPNALSLHLIMQNYNRKAAGLIDVLESILAGEEISADQRELRHMITSLETLSRDNDEPHFGRYGEQELSGFVTKFKSLLQHDDSGTDQEEPDNINTMATEDYTATEEDTDDEDNDGEAGDNDDDTEQDEPQAENDVATSSGGHEEGVASQP